MFIKQQLQDGVENQTKKIKIIILAKILFIGDYGIIIIFQVGQLQLLQEV
jgi:hypothetical protein